MMKVRLLSSFIWLCGVILTLRRYMERGAGHTAPPWEVIGRRRGGGILGSAEEYGEVGSGGEEIGEGTFGTSMVGV